MRISHHDCVTRHKVHRIKSTFELVEVFPNLNILQRWHPVPCLCRSICHNSCRVSSDHIMMRSNVHFKYLSLLKLTVGLQESPSMVAGLPCPPPYLHFVCGHYLGNVKTELLDQTQPSIDHVSCPGCQHSVYSPSWS